MEANHTLRNAFSSNLDLPKLKKKHSKPWNFYSPEPLPLLLYSPWKIWKPCPLGHFNVNLLNYNEHYQTNEFLYSLASNSLIPFSYR